MSPSAKNARARSTVDSGRACSDRAARRVRPRLVGHYGDSADAIIEETRAEYARVIPKLPYIGGKRNNGGDHYLRMEHVANAIAGTMLATGLRNLHICGNDRKGWLVQ